LTSHLINFFFTMQADQPLHQLSIQPAGFSTTSLTSSSPCRLTSHLLDFFFILQADQPIHHLSIQPAG
jgi:hypothetical protein